MQIRKAADVIQSGSPSGAQLEKINTLSKTALTAEEVYVFAVRLCDDQPDRDHERFSAKALRELAPMFVGKTGIMDHAWSADNQLGRIFDTEVVSDGGVTWLKAWVYMLRGGKSQEVIRQIEGGIKKEVSVGCAMGRTVCSVCGEDYGTCQHRKGEIYGTEVCTAILCEPVDAYEFSFVAVPAQKKAGVVKSAGGAKDRRLEKEAEYGRMYRKMLQQDMVKLALALDMGLSEALLSKLARSLDVEELLQVQKAFSGKLAEKYPPVVQLSGEKIPQGKPDSAFMI